MWILWIWLKPLSPDVIFFVLKWPFWTFIELDNRFVNWNFKLSLTTKTLLGQRDHTVLYNDSFWIQVSPFWHLPKSSFKDTGSNIGSSSKWNTSDKYFLWLYLLLSSRYLHHFSLCSFGQNLCCSSNVSFFGSKSCDNIWPKLHCLCFEYCLYYYK